MLTQFAQYYPPSSIEYERLWKEGLVVLDANVLLGIYRYPKKAREEFLSALTHFSDRLWIPHQVAMEFQINRVSVGHRENMKTIEDQKFIAASFLAGFNRLQEMAIDKRDAGVDGAELEKNVKQVLDSVEEALKKVVEAQGKASFDDPIRKAIDSLFEGKVGSSFTQEQLDSIFKIGEDRYRKRIPPGFADSDKDRGGRSADYSFSGINHIRKFGDLVLWEQLLAYVEAHKIQSVMLVTAERKEDWIWVEQGKSLGPLPALREEMSRRGKANLFWMYEPANFLSTSQKYTSEKVSPTSIQEVKQSQIEQQASTRRPEFSTQGAKRIFSVLGEAEVEAKAADAIYVMLRNIFSDAEITEQQKFPDFIVRTGELNLGFEVAFIDHPSKWAVKKAAGAVMEGFLAKRSGRVDEFHLFLVLENGRFDGLEAFEVSIHELIETYSIDSVVIGFVADNSFVQIANIAPEK